MFRTCSTNFFRRVAFAAAVSVAPAASPTAASTTVLTSSSALTTLTPIRFYGPSDGRRLTFQERADKRENKNRQNRGERQALQLEAEKIANIEFLEELEAEFAVCFAKAQTASLKITNMQRCLETVEIDVGGRKVPLMQAGQIVKVSPLELHVIPTQPAFTSPILQRLMRFDSTIAAQKEQNKIKLTLQRITTQRRDKAASDIRNILSDFTNKTKTIRTRYVKLISGVGAGDDVVQQLTVTIDGALKDFLELKTLELEELIGNVTSTGVDESDASM